MASIRNRQLLENLGSTNSAQHVIPHTRCKVNLEGDRILSPLALFSHVRGDGAAIGKGSIGPAA
jgi:hypothetical protein